MLREVTACGGIAKRNNVSVDKLKELNPNLKGNTIQPNQTLVINKQDAKQVHDLNAQWNNESEWNANNISAIQHARHDGNYVIVNKDRHTLTVYDKFNKPVYSTSNISTGASGNDYNTITKRNLSVMQNMSTPAGISTISSVGTYHGLPSF